MVFLNYRQINWPEWLTMAEFAVNNKICSATKISPFMVNYDRELRMEVNTRKRKIRKDNRICRRNKEDTRESWSSIEKGTREDKVASK